MNVISMEKFEAKRALKKLNEHMKERGMLDIISMSGGIRPIPFIMDGKHYWIDEDNVPHKGKPERKRM
jgi:hypothetical protein